MRNPVNGIVIGVVADMRREQGAWTLANDAEAQVLSYDDGTLGCTRNHLKVWTKCLQYGGDWAVVLEDDAILCEDWRANLETVLGDPPADIVGLYLGRGYPKSWQGAVRRGVVNAEQDGAHYIMSSHLLHGVGTAIRMSLVPDMLRFVGNMSPQDKLWPVDEQITAWARLRGHRVTYTQPSLVEHADGPTLLTHENLDGEKRKVPRRAWSFGSRDVWTKTATVDMP